MNNISEEEYSDFIKKNLWLIRPCDEYAAEARECKRIRARFHQYFIHGSFLNCSVWSSDSSNCKLCKDENNNKACLEIIKNETFRRLKRLEGHKNNDVWKRRTEPPKNWNSPLPEWWMKENSDSLLVQKAEEYDKFIEDPRLLKRNMCVLQ